jgi:hypothetical protein
MTIKRPILCLFAGVTLAISAAYAAPANTPIGMAVTSGTLQVDHARVSGTATIFEGSTVDTSASPSVVRLDNGARFSMAAETHIRVYPNRMVMEAGSGQMESGNGYEVEARTLRISPGSSSAVARIRIAGERKVTVASVRGTIRVANFAGLVVANVEAGSSLDFEPQDAGAAAPTHVSGCLVVKDGKPVIVDRTTNVVLELQGDTLGTMVGNRVEITGVAEKTPSTVEGASQVVKVAGLKLVAKGGCTAIAKKVGASVAAGALAGGAAAGAAGAGAAGAGAAAAGVGAATAAGAAGAAGAAAAAGVGLTTVAVVGGVAAAATVGGLAASGTLPGQGDSTPTASR